MRAYALTSARSMYSIAQGTDLTADGHVNALPYDVFFLTRDLKPYYFVNEVNAMGRRGLLLVGLVLD